MVMELKKAKTLPQTRTKLQYFFSSLYLCIIAYIRDIYIFCLYFYFKAVLHCFFLLYIIIQFLE